jgi:hypothetical protein
MQSGLCVAVDGSVTAQKSSSLAIACEREHTFSSPSTSPGIRDSHCRIKTGTLGAADTMNGDNYSSRGVHVLRRGAPIDANRRDSDSGRHGSSRDYPVSWPMSPPCAEDPTYS